MGYMYQKLISASFRSTIGKFSNLFQSVERCGKKGNIHPSRPMSHMKSTGVDRTTFTLVHPLFEIIILIFSIQMTSLWVFPKPF